MIQRPIYLVTPPVLFPVIVEQLGQTGLNDSASGGVLSLRRPESCRGGRQHRTHRTWPPTSPAVGGQPRRTIFWPAMAASGVGAAPNTKQLMAEIRIYPDADRLARAMAEHFATLAGEMRKEPIIGCLRDSSGSSRN
jgi:hypothetical protein